MFSSFDYNFVISILVIKKWTELFNMCSDVNLDYNIFDKIIENTIDKSTTRFLINSIL